MKRCTVYFLILLTTALFISACAPQQPPKKTPTLASISVAGFHQPRTNQDLLAGYIDDTFPDIPEKVMTELDTILAKEVQHRWKGPFLSTALTRQCREVIRRENSVERLPALRHWIQVGRCLPVDFLLVPQVFAWEEREGGEWGSDDPAKVILDLYLVDVKNEKLAGRFHFDEEQQSLSENLFSINRFFKRGGKWVSARQLATDGINMGLTELGL